MNQVNVALLLKGQPHLVYGGNRMALVQVEQWNKIDIQLEGQASKDAYVKVKLEAEFVKDNISVKVVGYYVGGGKYILRFMPEELGEWTYTTSSNDLQLNDQSGSFQCVEATGSNRGPVRVRDQFHFAYADGSPYFPFGTTCYAWIHQSLKLQEQTLETLKKASFNKLRMCVFPKYYSNNASDPDMYPFVQREDGSFALGEFNPAFFDHLDKRVEELMAMGIEVDLILLHPYDKGHWGFDRMTHEEDKRYLSYIVARYSAYRNIWWSMANEYDYMEEKTLEDWQAYIECVAKQDPHDHLLSIHQGDAFFNNFNPYITHSCVQLGTLKNDVGIGFGVYKAHRDIFGKPVTFDEVGYEGNLMQRWGRNTAQELVDKYWMAVVSGVYMGHGETYQDPEDVIWWAKGGILKGESPDRIAFLKDIIESSGLNGLNPIDKWWIINGAGSNGNYYLFYFGQEALNQWKFELPAFMIESEIVVGSKFKVDIIDTWNMTITPVDGVFEITEKDRYSHMSGNRPYVELPGKPSMAIRVTKVVEA